MTGSGFKRPQGDDLPAVTSTPGRLPITPQTPGKRPWAGELAGMPNDGTSDRPSSLTLVPRHAEDPGNLRVFLLPSSSRKEG
jgi:hypothetical protein